MFCQNCGSTVDGSQKICPLCGKSIFQYDQKEPIKVLSKEDYLALSKEYQMESKSIKTKYRTIMIIGIILVFIGAIVFPLMIPILGDDMLFNPGVGLVKVTILLALLLAPGIVLGVIGEIRLKRKPEELGVKYYQQYIEKSGNN